MDDIYVINENTFVTEGDFDSYESAIWTDRYSEYGDFEIYTSVNVTHVNLLQQDRILWIEDSEHQMIIEDVQIESDVETGNHLKVTGRSLESILTRRIVWVQTELSGNLQNGVRRLLNDSIINPSLEYRRIDNFVFNESEDPEITELTFEGQFTGDEVYDAIKKICDSVGIGFKITLNNENLFVFELYKGEDRSYSQESNPYVVFSPNFDNIVDSNYINSNSSLKNVTLVAGEGEGLSRRALVVGDEKISGLKRRELFTDARDISSSTTSGGTLSTSQYNALLEQRGKEKLLENKNVRVFDGQVDTTRMYQYGIDFFMGDITQLENEYGMESRVRVTEYIYCTDQSGSNNYPTFEVLDEEDNKEE